MNGRVGCENSQMPMLDSSYAASTYLNFQFYFWKALLRFIIHPSIPVPARECVYRKHGYRNGNLAHGRR